MKRMLIDAAHAEDIRVAIMDDTRLEDFDSETQGKQQLKGNIYIGHVSRVEPSLQAAFITYGGNRNGFLAFGEVHPQFFAIDKKEKTKLLDELAEQAARRRGLDLEEDEAEAAGSATIASTPEESPEKEVKADKKRPARGRNAKKAEATPETPVEASSEEITEPKAAKGKAPRAKKEPAKRPVRTLNKKPADVEADSADTTGQTTPSNIAAAMPRPRRISGTDVSGTDTAPAALLAEGNLVQSEAGEVNGNVDPAYRTNGNGGRGRGRRDGRESSGRREGRSERNEGEQRGGYSRMDSKGDSDERRQPGIHRRFRIQDVLKEGQKILVQVVKEERGSKGAALTTYFSLPGRFTVLMPNTPHAGGISRKITDPEERKALREAYAGLEIPGEMGLIIRTAGVGQPSEAIQKDFANLSNLWKEINEAFDAGDNIQCVHEDGSLIVRAMRDMNSEDIEEILVSGKRACKMAKDYAKNMMPDSTKLIKEYTDETPLFAAYQVEDKLHQLYHNRVPLPSGGSMVINPTEALVAVDINSGRATQERNIEETAVKTNLEACEELGRQIRLRDLAGLIVVDFIDMEDSRNIRKVENAIRKVLRKDRARVQFGRISEFGLLEISRQRLRPSFGESHLVTCPHCQGGGLVHSPSTSALMILRRLEEEDVRGTDRVIVSTSASLIVWLMNNKRDAIRDLEAKYKYHLVFKADESLVAPDHRLELVNVKSDGTEHSKTIEVLLREQPELPPELRKHGRDAARDAAKARRRDDDESATEGKDKEAATPREGRENRDRNDRGNREGGRREREDRTQRSEGKREGRPEQSARSERPARAPVKVTIPAEEAPKKVAKPAVDAPLEVQTMAAPEGKTVAVKANVKKVVVKAQADTDRDDVPLQVQKQAASAAKAAAKPAAKKPEAKVQAEASAETEKKPGSILSRLLTRG